MEAIHVVIIVIIIFLLLMLNKSFRSFVSIIISGAIIALIALYVLAIMNNKIPFPSKPADIVRDVVVLIDKSTKDHDTTGIQVLNKSKISDEIVNTVSDVKQELASKSSQVSSEIGNKVADVKQELASKSSEISKTEFSLIPSGSFWMGADHLVESGGYYDILNEKSPRHLVTISKPFYMQTTEVTQGQWQKVMGNNPSKFNNCGNDCPVEQVSWDDVQEFILKLNSVGKEEYRLPTEAEWEYAARAGTTTKFYTGNGDEDLSRAGWYDGNSGSKTHPVGQKRPNAWGLYDMHGNVKEWVQDGAHYLPDSYVTDPVGSFSLDSNPNRVFRGGSWGSYARDCRSAFRNCGIPGNRVSTMGFRLVRTRQTAAVGEIGRSGRFIPYSNGTVLDTKTNLMWSAKDNGSNVSSSVNWQNANSYCENYQGGGYTDWRMPTQDELAGLYDPAITYRSACGVEVHLTELIRLTGPWTWASDTRGSDAGGFDFYFGRYTWGGNARWALPVRSGK